MSNANSLEESDALAAGATEHVEAVRFALTDGHSDVRRETALALALAARHMLRPLVPEEGALRLVGS